MEYSRKIKMGKTGRVNWRNIRQWGIHQIFVDTFDFQAPEFYLKHGYKQVFELSEYPKTGKRHYYKKELQ